MTGWGLSWDRKYPKSVPKTAKLTRIMDVKNVDERGHLSDRPMKERQMTQSEWNKARKGFISSEAESIYDETNKKYQAKGKLFAEKRYERQQKYLEKGKKMDEKYKQKGVNMAQKFNKISDANAIRYYKKALAKNPITHDAVTAEDRIHEGQVGIDRGRIFRAQFDRGRVVSTSGAARGRVIDISPFGRGKVTWRR